MSAVTIQLTDKEQARLVEIAAEAGTEATECARALLMQVLGDPSQTLQEGADASASGVAPIPSEPKPLWMRIVELGETLAPEDRARIPRDASVNLDHYLYGLPKVE